MTSDHQSLDIRWLHRYGLLKPGTINLEWKANDTTLAFIRIQIEAERLMVTCRPHVCGSEDGISIEYPIGLEWTPCTFGGQRIWFRCPAKECGRRVALLYIGGMGVFACRHCYRLIYPSQRESNLGRIVRQAKMINHRLGRGSSCSMKPIEKKPSGMNWRTFWRLKIEHDALLEAAATDMAKSLGKMPRR